MLKHVTQNDLGPCSGRQWKDTAEMLECRWPSPPIDRWKAVYTRDFAEKYNLPLENVSSDLTPGIDYMEMDVQPYGSNGVACLANMLIRKSHDFAFFNMGQSQAIPLPGDRKLSHWIDLFQYTNKLQATTAFNFNSRDYLTNKRGFRQSAFAMYAEDVLPGYDFVTANAACRGMSMRPDYFPDGFAFWIAKASVWGKFETPYTNSKDPRRPKGDEFFDSHLFINIPHELVSAIFKDVPIGGR